MSTIRGIIGVSRAPFLLLPVTLVASGSAASARDGAWSPLRAALALVALVAAHVGVNALNEARDMETGVDLHTTRTPFSGGSGTLPAGLITVRVAYAWGLFATALGVGIGVWFATRVGWVLVPLLAVGAFSVLAYTHLLARLGVGEVFAGLGLGGLPVLGTSLVQDGHVGPATVAASIPAFLMTLNLLLLNEFPDEAADRAGGRRHLVILLSRPAAARVYAVAALLVPFSIGAAAVLGALPILAALACFPTVLLIPALRWALVDPREPVPLPALGANVAWNLATNAVLAAALGLARGW